MTDKAKLEKIKKLADAMYYAAFNITTNASLLRKAMDEYHQFIINEYHKEEQIIKELREEPVSEDLEEAAKKYGTKKHPMTTIGANESAHDFKAGAKWQKEQLMAKAVDVTVHIDAGGYPYIPQMELYDYDKDVPLAKEGDKYKVVLIKED